MIKVTVQGTSTNNHQEVVEGVVEVEVAEGLRGKIGIVETIGIGTEIEEVLETTMAEGVGVGEVEVIALRTEVVVVVVVLLDLTRAPPEIMDRQRCLINKTYRVFMERLSQDCQMLHPLQMIALNRHVKFSSFLPR